MKLRAFGATGLKLSPSWGSAVRVSGGGQRDPVGFVRLLETARERGVTFFDAADTYSHGESEALLGPAFSRRRSKVIVASKVGYALLTQRRLWSRIKPLVRPLIRLRGPGAPAAPWKRCFRMPSARVPTCLRLRACRLQLALVVVAM